MPAEDPVIEIMQHSSKRGGNVRDQTPVAAWILVNIILIHMLQKTSQSLLGQMYNVSIEAALKETKRNKPYPRQIMIFCLTLAGYSAKAYTFLREATSKCLPSPWTLKKYRMRIDGAPGFSQQALNMVRRKVSELKDKSKNLFVSLSCDDMAIRYIFCSLKFNFKSTVSQDFFNVTFFPQSTPPRPLTYLLMYLPNLFPFRRYNRSQS